MIDFIWKNEKASEHGIIVQSLPPITKAPERTQKIEIEGRDGDIVLSNGFSAYDKKVNIGLAKNYDVNWLINWLQGKGQVIFSNEDTVFYNAEIINQIDFKKLLSFKTATITFHVQPYKYLVKENKINFKGLSDIISGKNIYLNDSTNNAIDTFKIKGKCEQETRSGKNLFNLGNSTITEKGITATFDNSNYIVNGTSTGSGATFLISLGTVRAGTYTIQSILKSGTFTTPEGYTFATYIRDNTKSLATITNKSFGNIKTFTLNEDTELFYQLYVNSTGVVFNNCNVSVQLEEGSTATEYEQYGVSPSPDYPSEIKTMPSIRNLFNAPYTENNKLTHTAAKNDDYAITDYYAELEAGKTYTFSCKTSGTFGAGETYQTQIYLMLDKGFTTVWQMLNKDSYTFKAPVSGKYYIRYDVNISGETHSFWNFQIEEDTIAHDYVPYGAWAKVKITGKNLFNKDKVSIGYLKEDGSISNDNAYYTSDFISVLPNNAYYKSNTGSPRTKFYDKNKKPLNTTTYQDINIGGNAGQFIMPENAYFFRFSYSPVYIDVNTIQIEQGTTTTEYESYKEQEVLIDLSKPNIFDRNNTNTLNINMITNNIISSADALKTLYVKCDSNKTYTVEKIQSSRFAVGYTYEEPVIGSSVYNIIQSNDATKLTISPNSKAQYLLVFYYHATNDTLTEREILDSIKIYEGYTDYYELSSIGDTKDTLDIVNGQIVINKKIDKVVLNGSEPVISRSTTYEGHYRYNIATTQTNIKLPSSTGVVCDIITSNFNKCTANQTWGGSNYNNDLIGIAVNNTINPTTGGAIFFIKYESDETSTLELFKTWLSENNVTVYYELEKAYQVKLNVVGDLRTYKNVSHITNNGGAEMELQYYRNCEFDINNQGYVNSKPIIEIEGDEEISVYVNNNQSCMLNLDNEKIILDSEEQEAYYDTTLKNNKMNGEFPLLSSGNNKVLLEGKVKNVIIHPKSRWL